jgi:hypothetical protein
VTSEKCIIHEEHALKYQQGFIYKSLISGIRESGKIQNTDQLALNVINELVLPTTGRNLTLDHIGRTHRNDLV